VFQIDQLDDLAVHVEGCLASGQVPWRPYKSYRARGRPKLPPAK
jgi:hypothetical protein